MTSRNREWKQNNDMVVVVVTPGRMNDPLVCPYYGKIEKVLFTHKGLPARDVEKKNKFRSRLWPSCHRTTVPPT